MTAKPEPEQLYLSEDTAPPSIPAIERAIKYWREAVGEQADASKTTKQRHGHMLMLMGEHGVEKYPWLDPKTGKRKWVVADKTPKAKLVSAPKGDRPKRSRKTAAEADPFGATRGLLDEARAKQAASSEAGANGEASSSGGAELTPAQAAAKEHYEARTKRRRNGGRRRGGRS